MFLDVATDRVLEVGDRFEDAATDALPGDGGEEVLDGFEPGAGCGREMKDPTWVISEPLDDLGMLVRGLVVGDGMDHLSGRNSSLDGAEKLDIFRMGMLRRSPKTAANRSRSSAPMMMQVSGVMTHNRINQTPNGIFCLRQRICWPRRT